MLQVPQQPNFCDCGLYILHFVEQFLSDPANMTRYIVVRLSIPSILYSSLTFADPDLRRQARQHPKKGITGGGPEIARKRAVQKDLMRKLDQAMIKEDAWNEEIALAKRRTMRSEVEGLMKEYLPIKVAKDAKEAEEKKQREKKREERDARELAAGGGNDARKEKEREKEEQEQALAQQQATAAKVASKPRGGRGKKKAPEVIELEDSDDGDEEASLAGSPKKSQHNDPPPQADPAPSVAKPSSSSQQQQQPKPSSSSSGQQPTSADFLPIPTPAVASSPARPSPSHSQQHTLQSPAKSNHVTTSLAPRGLVDYASEEEGDVGNTQEEQDAEMERLRPRVREEPPSADSDGGRSPPPKKKKRNNPRSPSPPPPSSQQQRRSFTPEQSQPDSSIEIRNPVSPELAAPPANQEQLVENKAPSSSGKSKSRRTSARHKGTKGEGDKEVETLELD